MEVALGGIAAEYVTYGQANGGMSDIIQLEELDPLGGNEELWIEAR